MIMRPFLSALFIYAFVYFAAMISKLQIFKAIAVISCSLCLVSLVSIILPPPYGHFSFIIWVFALLVVAYNKRLHKKIWKFRNRFGGNNQPLLSINVARSPARNGGIKIFQARYQNPMGLIIFSSK